MIVVETERLFLRQFKADDITAMMRVFSDAEVMRYSKGTKSEQEVQDWLGRCQEIYDSGDGIGPWGVVAKASGELMGYCGLFRFADVGGQEEIEIGYRLARQYWGQGLATEAACGVRDHGFERLGLERMIAMIDPGNIASIRVAEKVGMTYWKEVMMEGYTHADRVYKIEREL